MIDLTAAHGGLILLAGTALLCAMPVIMAPRLRRKIDAGREREPNDA